MKQYRAKNRGLIARVPQRVSRPARRGLTVLAIDPGGSTGLALRLPDSTLLTVTTTLPSELYDFFRSPPDEVVLEPFNTAGQVDRYMIYTMDLVGGVKAICYLLGIKCFIQPPQRRYPWLQEAEALLAPKEHTKHEVDALAHLLAHEELDP